MVLTVTIKLNPKADLKWFYIPRAHYHFKFENTFKLDHWQIKTVEGLKSLLYYSKVMFCPEKELKQ